MKTLPVGLCGRVEQDEARAGAERRRQLVGSEGPVGSMEAHQARRGPGHGRTRGIGVVGRLEHHDLVARFAQRQKRCGDRLGRTRRDEDLVRGCHLEPVPRRLVGGDGLPKLGDALARRILVAPGASWLGRHLGSSPPARRCRESPGPD